MGPGRDACAWTPQALAGLAPATGLPTRHGLVVLQYGYVLLGLIVEAATGHTLAGELGRCIFGPLGLQDTLLPGNSPAIPSRRRAATASRSATRGSDRRPAAGLHRPEHLGGLGRRARWYPLFRTWATSSGRCWAARPAAAAGCWPRCCPPSRSHLVPSRSLCTTRLWPGAARGRDARWAPGRQRLAGSPALEHRPQHARRPPQLGVMINALAAPTSSTRRSHRCSESSARGFSGERRECIHRREGRPDRGRRGGLCRVARRLAPDGQAAHVVALTLVDRHDYHQVITERPGSPAAPAPPTRCASRSRTCWPKWVRLVQTEISGFDLPGLWVPHQGRADRLDAAGDGAGQPAGLLRHSRPGRRARPCIRPATL